MIKLLWNTHNQLASTSNKIFNKKKDAIDLNWGLYHKDNSDKWIYYLLNNVDFKAINDKKDIENGDILILVDSSVEKKNEFYTKLRLTCSKMFLIHLGDESGSNDLSQIYSNFNFVWRTFCFNRYFNNQKVSCFPIGYKSGTFFKKNITEKKYKWAFIGTPHKSSRHDLLFQLSSIKPSFSYKTRKFNEKNIEVDQMSEILSSTEFIPCPNGFVHPETYRVYEALECNCIPIVESTHNYYDRLFPNNPFLKVDKWTDARSIIVEWKKEKVEKKREECNIWWNDYKKKIQDFMKKKIDS